MSDESPPLETPGAPALQSPDAPDTPQSVAAKEAELSRQLVATAKLVGSNEALNWDHLNGAAALVKGYTPIEQGLPDQLEINPDTIEEPVLSRQGWVLPTIDKRARFGGR